ncbi:MAG: excisionase family DNA binding protein [Oceanicoccus sp.]
MYTANEWGAIISGTVFLLTTDICIVLNVSRYVLRENLMVKQTKERVYLTPVEAAELLMVSTASIRLWASKGLLAASVTVGGHRRFQMRDIYAFARSRGIAIEARQNNDLRVLVVDDDAQIRGYLAELLETQPGIEAMEFAVDGFDAGQKVAVFQPDVILLDIMMPGMDGFETCRRLKGDISTRHIRLVAMTGYGSQNNVDRILLAGAQYCLAKPFDKEKLFMALGIA